MTLSRFKLERYFAEHEFSTEYLLCCSDCDGLKMNELLCMADNECRELWEKLKLGYTYSKGHPFLREEIAKLYNGISPEDILVCAPEEGIFITMNVILNKKNNIACTYPGYQSLYQIAHSIGAFVLKWQPEEEWYYNNKFLIDFFEYQKKWFHERLKLISINFPHNPTGCLLPKEDFLTIINIAKKNNTYVFSDEMYRYLEFNENDRLPSACELYDKAISLFGISKTFSLAGLRIGWLITKDKELMKNLEMFKDYTSICSSAPSEILALTALRNKDFIISENLKTIKRNLKYLDDFFKKYSKVFSWVKPKAGTICFPKLSGAKMWAIDSYTFCEKVRKEAGILLLPSNVYGYGDRHFRIGFGRKNMPEALKKLEEYLDKIW